MNTVLELLQRYRRDRKTLLDFILSGTLLKKVVLPPGAVSLHDVDLDQVSVDYVLNVSRKGGMLDLSEAIKDYHNHSILPHLNNSGLTHEFFLVTSSESSGSPPRRPPPIITATNSSPILSGLSKTLSFTSVRDREHSVDDIESFTGDEYMDEVDSQVVLRRIHNDNRDTDVTLLLPSFATGITDDDLRETAYELLLASVGASRGLTIPLKSKSKDKKSRLMRKLGRSKSEHVMITTQRDSGLVGLLETLRVQMEISEAMDVRTRQGLLNAVAGRSGKKMNALLIPLELLTFIYCTDFSDMKMFIKWQKRQLNMLEEGLINHTVADFGGSRSKANELKSLLLRLEESESFPSGKTGRAECLRSIRDVAGSLSGRQSRGDLAGEICHWADGYHLNVRLYEKLLVSVFDILDEGKLTEEAEEILELLKLTWCVLGITESLHYTCYTWVLLNQFIVTNERGLMRHAIKQLEKVSVGDRCEAKERSYMKSLRSKVHGEEGLHDYSFIQSFLLPIQNWAERKLQDYHFHFSDAAFMEEVLTISLIMRQFISEDYDLEEKQPMFSSEQDLIENYVSSSIKNAFTTVSQSIESTPNATHGHPLAILAEESNKLLIKDTTIFMPVISSRLPSAKIISASLIHKLYGSKLKPFLNSVEHLSDDVVSVFLAAIYLEQHVVKVIESICEGAAGNHNRKINPYEIELKSGTLVMRWINLQLGTIRSWVDRAIQQEVWDPISPNQCHGSSIVEVYRIIEETVDQFFALKIPMKIAELKSLLSGIDNAFHLYVCRIIENLATKEDLIPPEPVLTRYKKEHGIKGFVKKEVNDLRLPDERHSNDKINALTIQILCVQLNTLQYLLTHMKRLEDSIWERWMTKNQVDINLKCTEKNRSSVQKITLDGSRKDTNAAIDRLCEFMGTKIIFWDLREPFLDSLYKPSVSHYRLELLTESLDVALNQLCDIIVDPLRDRLVTCLLRASLAGFLRVLLNGGPSRSFVLADAKLIEEDLEILKEFFISGGDGLPRGTVENHVGGVRKIVKLHGYETGELIEELKAVSGGGNRGTGGDGETLLRILCHRNDPEASNFLKKQYKIPRSTV